MDSKGKKTTGFKLITQSSDSFSYQLLNGCMPPYNTPLSPNFKSPWKNIIVEDNDKFVWNQNETKIQPKAFEISRQDLKAHMQQLDRKNFSHLVHLSQRKSTEQLKYSEIWNLNKPQTEIQKIVEYEQQTEQYTLKRQVVDPQILQRKEQMNDNFKWLDVQKKHTDPKITLLKEIKFRLNQLAPQNYIQTSKIILDFTGTSDNNNLILEAIIEKGTYEDKYRTLYAQLIDDWMIILNNDEVQQIKLDIKNKLIKNLEFIQYNEIYEKYTELDDNEILILETKRKKNLLGNAKFLSELICWHILEIEFVNNVLREVLTRYINEYKKLENTNSQNLKKHNEENIEIFITILDYCGHIYCADDSMSVFEYDLIDSIRNKVKIFQSVRLSRDGAQQMIDVILNNYIFSKRIFILLENLKEIVASGWQNKVKIQRIQQYSDEEDDDDEDYPV